MSHHIRYFRFSNRTQINVNEDLQLEDFFDEDLIEDENLLLEEGPPRPRRKGPINSYSSAVAEEEDLGQDEKELLDSGI